jgi:transcription-repair coupling factor (superfamily II helicase)
VKVPALLDIYCSSAELSLLPQKWSSREPYALHLKGTRGSSDAIIAAALISQSSNSHLFILPDKEEAAYFKYDIQQLIGQNAEVLWFPASYKKAYQYEETENANILQRAETLQYILSGGTTRPSYIVTYPQALAEKVINKRALIEHTFPARVGDTLDRAFLEEFLQSYDFEKSDFVYEAGQYAIRGGIIDIYSYSNELPYRIELFGDEIESIRTFHPETQLSIDTLPLLLITPNTQTKLWKEERDSLLHYLPESTVLWMQDASTTIDLFQHNFTKVTQQFDAIVQSLGANGIIRSPDYLVDSASSFLERLTPFHRIEWGALAHLPVNETITVDISIQPSFNKEFSFVAEELKLRQNQGYQVVLASDSFQQIARLRSLLEELDPYIRVDELLLSLRSGFIDHTHRILCFTEHQLFERFHRYKSKERYSKSKGITLKELKTLQPGDYVTHIDYGVARFAGLERMETNERVQENIRLVFRDNDLMTLSVQNLHKITRFSGKDGEPPVMSKLGSGDWEAKKSKVKKQVKDIAKDLIQLYAKRKAAPGFAFSPDSFLQVELESSFIYEDTPDQAKATADVKKDMEQAHPMDRLVCGDVGFGKTEVAVRAAFKAACDGKQVAVLVPTTILAMQHYKTFKERLSKFPVMVEYINRFKTTKQIKETLERVAEGKTSILIGTHRIINKDVAFKNLGLLIIDEEQKFGVKVKDKLKEFKVNVDSLTLTATPIPRTLHFSLMGARDLSIIATPPPNRQPVTTEVHVFNEEIVRDAIVLELKRGGQAFIVHNRIKDIESIAATIKRLVPDARVNVAHGQMEGDKLEEVMLKFVEHEFDVLVSTNIIESGLDIPNANTIIINGAHMFGLSDLHQMRGRVGRSNKKAYCYLFIPPPSSLTTDSRKRLSVLEEFSDLGDGFKVAMRDLDIRGAGNLLGAEQSGFISDIGFEMYHKILDEAIAELKATEFAELFAHELQAATLQPLVADCVVETDLSILIPERYVSNISERLSLYSQLDNCKKESELEAFAAELSDRFGPHPPEVVDLIQTVRLRWMAESLGFEKITLKNKLLKGQFLPSERTKYYESETFGTFLQYVQQHPKTVRLKEIQKKLLFIADDIASIPQAYQLLQEIYNSIPTPVLNN